MSRSKALWVLFFIVVIGVLLRLYNITDRSLWFDEAFSWRLIQFPLSEMIDRAIADVHPPLYYIILKLWGVVFGTTLLSIRSFSVAVAGLTIAAGYLFATSAWKSRAVGLAAATFLALSGWQIAFAWEARMYTLGMFFAFISSWLLIKAVRKDHFSVLWWIAYGIAAAAFAYVHYFAFFTLAAHAIFVVGYILVSTRGRIGEILNMSTTWYSLLGAAIAILIYLPWIPSFIDQNQQVQAGWWPEPITSWSIPNTVYKMFIPLSSSPTNHGLGALLTLLPITLTILGGAYLLLSNRNTKFSLNKGQADAAWLTILCSVIPFILAIVLSALGQSLYQDRFLVFSQLFILVALAVIIWQIRMRYVSTVLTLLVIGMFSWSFVNYWQEIAISDNPGAQAAASFVVENRDADEPILVSSPFIYFAIEYYAKEELGNVVDPDLYSETGELSHFGGGPILTEADVVGSELLNHQSSGEAIWVVDTTGFGGSELDLSVDWKHVTRETFSEVFPHQGDVIVNKYVKN